MLRNIGIVVAVLSFGLVCQSATAQSNPNTNTLLTGPEALQNLQDLDISTSVTGSFREYDNRYKGSKGSPYFWDNWVTASIQINNITYEDVKAKFNVYENKFLYLNAKGEKFVLSPNRLTSFTLKDSLGLNTVYFGRYPSIEKVEPSLTNRLFVPLYSGKKSTFILAPQKHVVKADYKAAYSPGREYDEFVDNSLYFIVLGDDKPQRVKLNKRNLFKALPDKHKQVEAYIASERIDTGTANGWTKALAYYDSL